jgi:membrane protein DedA with SNARE-associated domain
VSSNSDVSQDKPAPAPPQNDLWPTLLAGLLVVLVTAAIAYVVGRRRGRRDRDRRGWGP